MEAAGPSMGQATPIQSTPQLSPKKSPKKHLNKPVKFRQHSNNSSPKKSVYGPSTSNLHNVPLSAPMSSLHDQYISAPILTSQLHPNTSASRSHQDPFSRRVSKDPFSSASDTYLNTPDISQKKPASQVPEVHSLMITVHKNVPYERIVQKDVKPQRADQNDATQVSGLIEGDVTPRIPYQSRFPQGRPFQYDSMMSKSERKRVTAHIELQLANKELSEKENGGVQLQKFVQNVVQPQRIVQNGVQPQRSVRKNAEGTVQSDVPPGRFYQPRFPKRSQYNSVPLNDRLTPRQDVNPPNTSSHTEQANGEAATQAQLNYRERKLYQQDQNYSKKVIVSGFPAYTKPEELVRKLSIFGHPQLEIFKNRVAVVAFETEQETFIALKANETIPVYGTILTIIKYTGHKNVMGMIKANRRVLKNEGPPIISPTQLDLTGDFDKQLKNIEDAIRLTQEEVTNINILFEDIEKYMRMIFPTCEAVPFGSITTGQGIKSSDADCFLSLVPGSDGRPGHGAAEQCSQFVNRAARLLRLYPNVFSQLVAIPRANTPIIKFLHVPTNVHCDLNSKTPLGVQNSRLVGHVLRHDVRFGSCALLLKYWARVHMLSGTGRLTNYALLLLLLFYLQQNLIPPVYKLQGPAHSFVVEQWEAGFDRAPFPFLREVPPLRDLLGGFFCYYATFDFDRDVVCPFLGRAMRKVEFECNKLPPQYSLYQRNISLGHTLPVRTSSCLCVQDPFELSHNVSSAVTYRLASDIKAHIKLAAAAYTQEEKSPGDFLRTILLTRPPSLEPEGRGGGVRNSLPSRLLNELADSWQQALRDAILNRMYKESLLIELTRMDYVSREVDIDQEVYYGTVRRPIWRRDCKPPSGPRSAPAAAPAPAPPTGAGADLLVRQQVISLNVHQNTQFEDVHVPFELEISFRAKPRGCVTSLSPREGATDADFKSLRAFLNSFLHRWQRVLLAPHLPIDTTRVLPKPNTPTNKPRSPKKKAKEQAVENVTEPMKPLESIETMAFVNSNHKNLSESLAAISLNNTDENSVTGKDS